MKKILAICGSTRQSSANLNLLKAIEKLFIDEFKMSYYLRIGELPQFNPDLDTDDPPTFVKEFRETLASADGFIICTPEYAHGVPGSLKNAIDWIVSSSELNKQVILLITASTDGRFGHQALLETLKVIEARNIEELQLLISFIKTKINQHGKITDTTLEKQLSELVSKFIKEIEIKIAEKSAS